MVTPGWPAQCQGSPAELSSRTAAAPCNDRGLTWASRATRCGISWHLAPTIVALLVLPHTVRLLGVERYGILALILVVHDYFNYFDFGLGRASTHFLASALHDKKDGRDVGAVFWTCLIFHVGLGVLVGVLFWLALPIVAPLLLRDSPALLREGIATLRVASLLPPVLLFMIAGRGALLAAHRFDLVPCSQGATQLPDLCDSAPGGAHRAAVARDHLRICCCPASGGNRVCCVLLRILPISGSPRFDLALRRPTLRLWRSGDGYESPRSVPRGWGALLHFRDRFRWSLDLLRHSKRCDYEVMGAPGKPCIDLVPHFQHERVNRRSRG